MPVEQTGLRLVHGPHCATRARVPDFGPFQWNDGAALSINTTPQAIVSISHHRQAKSIKLTKFAVLKWDSERSIAAHGSAFSKAANDDQFVTTGKYTVARPE